MLSASDLLLPPGINWLTRLCVKSTKSITVYKHLKKLLQNKKKMHHLQSMFYFARWRYSCGLFFLFFFEKMLAIVRKCFVLYCWCLKSSLLCTNMNCMCKKSYSGAWQKVTTDHCEFNVWPLYLIFKIWYQSSKT